MATYTLGINCTNYDSSIINKIICYIEDKSVKVEGRINSLSYTSEQVNSKLKIIANVFSMYMIESIDVIYNSETIKYIPKNNIIEFNITNGTNVLIAIKVNYYSISTNYSYKSSDKNLRGGYAIISLKSPTIYEDIETNLYKPILLTDIVIDDIEKNDVFSMVRVEDTTLIFDNIYGKQISINDDNVVEYNVQPSNESKMYNYMVGVTDVDKSSSIIFGCILNKKFTDVYDFVDYVKSISGSVRLYVGAQVSSTSGGTRYYETCFIQGTMLVYTRNGENSVNLKNSVSPNYFFWIEM